MIDCAPLNVWMDIVTMNLDDLGLSINKTTELSGGLTNACLKVDTDTGSYVWRPISKEATLLGADREKEQGILRALEPVAFTPNAFISNEHGLLVEWLEGEVIALDKAQNVAIELMTQVHELDTKGFDKHFSCEPLSYKKRIHDYWVALLPENQSPILKPYIDYFQQQDDTPKFTSCLCHNDIGAYNIIVRECGYGLIDWEYASFGDPSQDLAIMITANQFNSEDAIQKYCHIRKVDVEEWTKAVAYWTPWMSLMGSIWFSLGYQLLKDPCYKALAEREMNNLLKLCPLPNK